jgi:hypothetical protein
MAEEKRRDEIPEDFGTPEAAGEFWDTHDSTDYEDLFEDVEVEVDLKKRCYIVELDATTAEQLKKQAQKEGMTARQLAGELIEKELTRTP